jgi:HPt (histidine-containing phosphotransfer) domain-containing protein
VSAGVPNERLGSLIAILGETETRELVRIYLASVPKLLKEIAGTDRENARRAAHSLKSSSQQMGAAEIAAQALELEKRLDANGPAITPLELSLFQARYKKIETALRPFGGAATS